VTYAAFENVVALKSALKFSSATTASVTDSPIGAWGIVIRARPPTSWSMAPASVEFTLPWSDTSPMIAGSRVGKAAKPGMVCAVEFVTAFAIADTAAASLKLNGPPESVTSPK
jgi:hypothetical protein